ncbi:MAG: ring-1,2-phenylacetyl-CoA epoxidase subunit PaaE, partial [Bradymonadia bacterium]
AALRGKPAPPFVPRNGDAYAHRTKAIEGLVRRRLPIVAVERLTEAAVKIRFTAPEGETFKPGQFLTLCIELEGVEHRRAYSICSDVAVPGEWAIGVKQTPGGLVSTWLNAQLAAQLTGEAALVVMGPSGSYGPTLGRGPRTVALVSCGSGITPNLAIAYGVLGAEPHSTVKLVFANRDAASVMFRAELDALQARHPERFELREVLEDTQGYLSAGDLDWVGAADAWFICGPAPMMSAATDLLANAKVAPDRIHQEHFSAAPRAEGGLPTEPQDLLLKLGNTQITTVVDPGKTLLEAGLAAGADMPYSCALGGCGACKVALVDGDVVLDVPHCLTDRERADGYVLACVARPTSPCTVRVDR